MNLGENIYKYRTQKNMSQGDFADALEVSRQSVSKWENNSAVPELDKLVKMAELFGITIDELVKGDELEQPTALPQAANAESGSNQQWHGRYTVGMLLITFGILNCILFVILQLLLGDALWGVGIGAVMIACGICCWAVEKHTALVCGWIVYLALYILFIFTTGGLGVIAFTWAGAFSILLFLIAGPVLSAVTLTRLWRGQIAVSKPAKIVLTVLIGILLLCCIGRVLPINIEV